MQGICGGFGVWGLRRTIVECKLNPSMVLSPIGGLGLRRTIVECKFLYKANNIKCIMFEKNHSGM